MRFTNVSGEPRDIPSLGLAGIPADEEFEVTGDDAQNLLTDPAFKRTDKPADKPAKTSPEEK